MHTTKTHICWYRMTGGGFQYSRQEEGGEGEINNEMEGGINGDYPMAINS